MSNSVLGTIIFLSLACILSGQDKQEKLRKKVWEFADEGCTAAACDGNFAFFGSKNFLHCVNVDSGKPVWKHEEDSGWIYGEPAVVGSLVYVCARNTDYYSDGDHGKALCFDSKSGKKIWAYTHPDPIRLAPAVDSGRVVVASGYKIVCLKAATGEKTWEADTNKFRQKEDLAVNPINESSTPVICDGRLYFGAQDNKLYCIDMENGSPVWKFSAQGWFSSSVAVAQGMVFALNEDGKLYCVDSKTGNEIWHVDSGGKGRSSPTFYNGCVYVAENSITCYSARTGKKLWSTKQNGIPSGSGDFSSPAAIDGFVIAAMGSGNSLYCLDSESGSIIWNFAIAVGVSTHAVIHDGRVLVQDGGRIVCIEAKNLKKKGKWPMFRGSAARTGAAQE